MATPVKINAVMFNLLIEMKMNGFTVTELRDAMMNTSESYKDINYARRYVYRQIVAFLNKGWLSYTGSGHSKRYKKTGLFLNTHFAPLANRRVSTDVPDNEAVLSIGCDFSTLSMEKKRCEGELAIVLGEVEEYQSLMGRFPNQVGIFTSLFDDAKERSAKLLGRINALTKVLNTSSGESSAC